MEVSRLVFSGELSSKWLKLERLFTTTAGVVVTKCSGRPTEVLAECRRLIPYILVVDEAFVESLEVDQFSDALDFGRSIWVLVEIREDCFAQAKHFLRMGCAGVLSRSATTAKARQAVQAISSGELWADRKTLSHLVRELLSEANHHLTRREAEIQALLGEGLRNHEIADRLFISPQTVRWHLRSMYSKLGTHDRHSIKSRLLAGLE